MACPMGSRGSSEANGSWKTTCMSRRIFRRSAVPSSVSSVPVELDRARGRPDQLQHGASRGRLPAARLADEAQGLPGGDAEGDPRDGVDRPDPAPHERPAAQREFLHQVGDLQQGRAGRPAPASSVPTSEHGHAITLSTTPSEKTCPWSPRPTAVGEVAGGTVLAQRRGDRGDHHQLGLGLAAEVGGQRAARRERAAGAVADHGGRGARDLPQPLRAVAVEPRQRAEQAERVGHGGPVEDVLGGPDLDRAPGVHHQHAVGQARDDAEVVGDQEQRGPGLRHRRLERVRAPGPAPSRRARWWARRPESPRGRWPWRWR